MEAEPEVESEPQEEVAEQEPTEDNSIDPEFESRKEAYIKDLEDLLKYIEEN